MHSVRILPSSPCCLPIQDHIWGKKDRICWWPCPCGAWPCPLWLQLRDTHLDDNWASTSLTLALSPPSLADTVLPTILSAQALWDDCLYASPVVLSCWIRPPPQFGWFYSSSKNQLYFLCHPWSGLPILCALQSPHGSQFSPPSHPSLEALEDLFQYSLCNQQESRLRGHS